MTRLRGTKTNTLHHMRHDRSAKIVPLPRPQATAPDASPKRRHGTARILPFTKSRAGG